MSARPARRRAFYRLGLAAALGAASCTGVATSLSGRPGPEAGALRGKTPTATDGVRHVPRLTDGITSALGDPVLSDLTAAFEGPGAFVTYDLGATAPIDCAAITADAAGRFLLAASEDGRTFLPVWRVPAAEGGGMQPRVAQELAARGRYLRLSAEGPEGTRAVAELSAAGPCPVRWPPPLARQQGTPAEEDARTKAWIFAVLSTVYVLVYRKKAPDFLKLLIALPLGLAIALVVALANLWPPSAELGLTLGAALGTIAAALGVRLLAARRRARRKPGVSPEAESS